MSLLIWNRSPSSAVQVEIRCLFDGTKLVGGNVLPQQTTVLRTGTTAGAVKLDVSSSSKSWWSGVVPTNTRRPLVVHPRQQQVSSGGRPLPPLTVRASPVKLSSVGFALVLVVLFALAVGLLTYSSSKETQRSRSRGGRYSRR